MRRPHGPSDHRGRIARANEGSRRSRYRGRLSLSDAYEDAAAIAVARPGTSSSGPTYEDQVGEVLAAWPHAKVQIEGYADSQGTEEYNDAPSDRHAASVKAWLLSHYPSINRGNLSTTGYGEGSPTASNETRTEGRRIAALRSR